MPSKSKPQAKLMRAAAHDKGFAKKAGVPQSVAKEYVAADKRKGAWRSGVNANKTRGFTGK
jgi:hypothetical protein